MSRAPLPSWTILAALAGLAAVTFAPPAHARSSHPDTLVFVPSPAAMDSLRSDEDDDRVFDEDEWLRPPFGDRLLTDSEEWRSRRHHRNAVTPVFDYNRVDPARLGLAYEAQAPGTFLPRVGARVEYATGRERWLYGVQFEQPLVPRGRLAAGISMVRRTDHNDLQQVDDVENSLALLFGRQDYRDYFEREGFGTYLAWRVPDFSTVSAQFRNDDYRSLSLWRGTRSLLQRDRTLRDNPPIDEGEIHAATLRLERFAHRTHRTRAGFYHWLEFERAGHGLGGDFSYSRLFGDARSVLRLSPATTLSLRFVGGHTADGVLPAQKQYTVGGVDGLRAHEFAKYRGDQMLLAQAEYVVGLWQLRASSFEGGLHAIAFLDAGRAWFNPEHEWDLRRQHLKTDGGFGLGTSEDNMRVYFAKNLQDPKSDFVISVRLQRPF
jgi:Omp85 superfamily domain